MLSTILPGAAAVVVDAVTTLVSDEVLALSTPRFLLVSALEALVNVANSPFSCFSALD
jgi:hypothetical protein